MTEKQEWIAYVVLMVLSVVAALVYWPLVPAITLVAGFIFGGGVRKEPQPTLSMERSIISLGPDDVVILTVRGKVTRDQAERLRRSLKGAFPNNRAVVVEGGARLTVNEAA